jgi:hypothetical protein|tara:strand:- start:859 stop:999 length:141 start_codon:yes stop_codon:yes gene_type:complete
MARLLDGSDWAEDIAVIVILAAGAAFLIFLLGSADAVDQLFIHGGL